MDENTVKNEGVGLDADSIPPPIEKRGRGRPAKIAGAGNTQTPSKQKKAAEKNLDVDSLAQKLLIAHSILAVLLKADYIAISENESKSIAKAIIEILERYSVEYNSDFMLWVNLTTALSIVYIPRFKKYNDGKKG